MANEFRRGGAEILRFLESDAPLSNPFSKEELDFFSLPDFFDDQSQVFSIGAAGTADGKQLQVTPALGLDDISGLCCNVVSATQVEIHSGIARCNTPQAAPDKLNERIIRLQNPSAGPILTCDIDVVGVNGRDGGKFQDTWYSVYVMAGPNLPTASLLSLSEFNPVLPGGYTVGRRIGWARTTANAALRLSKCSGPGKIKTVTWNADRTTLQALLNGTSTVEFVIDLGNGGFIPPSAEFFFGLINNNGAAGIQMNLRTTELTPVGAVGMVGVNGQNQVWLGRFYTGEANPALGTQGRVSYINSAAAGDSNLFVAGYEDRLRMTSQIFP